MKIYRWLLFLFLTLFLFNCAKPRTYTIHLQYQPSKEFPSLQQKAGPILGILPFKDERPDPYYLGVHTPLRGVSSYFKSEPFPLEKAIRDSLLKFLSDWGIKTILISYWDRKIESLRQMEADSILMIEIKKFWAEVRSIPFRTEIKTSIHLVIHLGVKREGKVFSRNVAVDKEMAVFSFAPEKIEEMANETLTEIFDTFFSNPY